MLKRFLQRWLGLQELNDIVAIQKKRFEQIHPVPKPEDTDSSGDDMWPEPPSIKKGYNAKVRRVT